MRFSHSKIVIILMTVVIGCASQPHSNREDNIDKPVVKNCEHDSETLRCVKYIKNYDGDTITFNIDNLHPLIGHNISVRVNGIDTPEIKGKAPCEKARAKVAQKIVSDMLSNARNIELRNVKREKYFRILADVYADGRSVAEMLLNRQLAYTYDGGTKSKPNWCETNNK